MITIKKDDNTVICSKNTFETTYKRLGYEIVNPSKKETKVEKTEKVEDVKPEIEEIPVVEMKSEKKSEAKKGKSKSK